MHGCMYQHTKLGRNQSHTSPEMRMPIVHYRKISISGNIHCSLYLHLMRQPVKDYLKTQGIIGPGTYDSVAWEVINKAQGSRLKA